MNKTRIVITGLGVIASNGVGKMNFSAALRAGKSGIAEISYFDTKDLDIRIAGQADDFDPSNFLDKKEIRRMERFTQMAVAASSMAIEDAELHLGKVQPDRCGVILGTGMGSIERTEKECKTLLTQGPGRISPLYIATAIPNAAASQVSISMGFRGFLGTTLTSCSAGIQSVGEAYFLMQRGIADVMIAGASEASITSLYLGGFSNMKALSTRNEDPERASRPFDNERDGFVLAEGAGIVVMETLAHASKRDARIYGEIAGFGVSSDAYHITSPDLQAGGMQRAMQWALSDSSIHRDQVDYINAHGSGTKLNDSLETLAIKEVFGEKAYSIPVSSTKSMTGHSLSSAGAIELVGTLLAMEEGFIPPTINYNTPDPKCDLDYVPNRPRFKKIETAMCNSFGFGGQNASIIVKKF